MKKYLPNILIATVILTLLGLGIWYEMAMWTECRATNSFWYCMRLMSR